MAKPRASFFKRLLKWTLILFLVLFLGVGILAGVFWFHIHQTNGEVMTGGTKRTYLLHVPASYRPGKPVPLVISIHGFAEWPAHLMDISHWNKLSDEFGFLVVYPSGSGLPLHWFSFNRPDEASKSQQDVQFVSDLIDKLEREYSIDADRVYANGLSNGAGMSFLLAARLSERIAAIGGVSGAYLLPWDEYKPKRAVPAVIIHGTADPIVSFHGGYAKRAKIGFPDIPKWVETFAAHNGCKSVPEQLPSTGSVSALRYTGGPDNADVEFYTVEGGGHAWPGGKEMPRRIVGHTTQDMDATRAMWEFFMRHPMARH